MHDDNISVVIPTYGEGRFLRDVLQALAHQTYDCFNVTVVDNNEFPSAWPICEPFTPRVAFIHCPQRGLSAARNAGIGATRGEYVAFLDDDSVPERTWAAELHNGLCRYKCAAAGGRVELAFDGCLPDWYPQELRFLLSELRYEGADIPAIADAQYVVGANFCVARRYLEAVGDFRLDFGRYGSCLRSSEELELCKRIIKSGGRVAFLSAPVVWHHIQEHRYTFKYLLKRSLWQGRSDAYLEVLHGRPVAFGRRSNLRNLVELLRRVCLFALCTDRTDAVLATANLVREYGYLIGYLKTTILNIGFQSAMDRKRV